MVKTRTRRRRHRRSRSRYARPVSASLSRSPSSHPLDAFILFSSLIVLCLLLIRQPGIAQVLQLPAQPSLERGAGLMAAMGRAFQFAQVFEPTVITQQGSQVVVNGRSYAIPWQQRQNRIALTDTALLQLFGVDLLSTNDASKQPIEWFSEQRSSPIVLPTWHSEQYRFLDISELPQHLSWQLEPSAGTLRITTPTAKVTALRQGRQSWGDRIVVDLDRAAPWQVNEQSGLVTITLDAAIDPAVVRSFKPTASSRITAAQVESNQGRTILRVGVADGIRPRVWAIPNPNRLLIDARPDSLVERNILWAPGVRWKQQFVKLGSSQFPIVALEVNPRQPGVTLKPIVSNLSTVVGTAPLVATAQNLQAAAAINGGFFNRNNQLPLGAIRRDSRWISGPILNRGAIGWSDAGETAVGHLKLQETLKTSTGHHFPVIYLNSGYVGLGIYRHTQDWGDTYTPILDHERIVTVRNGRVTQQQRAGAAGQTPIPIPADGYLLVIRGDDATFNALPKDTTIELQTATQPINFDRYPHVVGAGPLLVQNRRIVLNPQAEQFSEAFRQQGAVRSVIATTAEGNLLMATIHNRIGGAGPTLAETAQLMQQMGVVNALNLDGGSSTSLYLGGRLLDRIPTTAARVHNGIGVFIQPGS